VRERTVIRTPDAPIMPIPTSQAVAYGDTLYVGGQAGFDAGGRLAADDFEGQFRRALDNLQAVVTAAGGTLDQALKVTVYVRDLERYAALNAIYAEYFAASPPARKVVQCELLGELLVEVDAIVALPTPAANDGSTA